MVVRGVACHRAVGQRAGTHCEQAVGKTKQLLVSLATHYTLKNRSKTRRLISTVSELVCSVNSGRMCDGGELKSFIKCNKL